MAPPQGHGVKSLESGPHCRPSAGISPTKIISPQGCGISVTDWKTYGDNLPRFICATKLLRGPVKIKAANDPHAMIVKAAVTKLADAVVTAREKL